MTGLNALLPVALLLKAEQDTIQIKAMLIGMDVLNCFLKSNLVNIWKLVPQEVMLAISILLKWIKCLVTLHSGVREALKQKIKSEVKITNSVIHMMVVLKMFQMFIHQTPDNDNKTPCNDNIQDRIKTQKQYPCLKDLMHPLMMPQLVMFQIGVNGLTVHLNVTVGQGQEIDIMSIQTGVMIVPMIFMRFNHAEVMKQTVPLQGNRSTLMDNNPL
jgi:hypothetical protein